MCQHSLSFTPARRRAGYERCYSHHLRIASVQPGSRAAWQRCTALRLEPHGEPPGEGSPPQNAPPGRFAPLLRSVEERVSPSAEGEPVCCPGTPPPYQKGGRKVYRPAAAECLAGLKPKNWQNVRVRIVLPGPPGPAKWVVQITRLAGYGLTSLALLADRVLTAEALRRVCPAGVTRCGGIPLFLEQALKC